MVEIKPKNIQSIEVRNARLFANKGRDLLSSR
jgi:hypothetical protein